MARSSPATVVSVRTTPLTCGCHASEMIRMRCEGASGSIRGRFGKGIGSGSLFDPGLARFEKRQPIQRGPIDQFHAAVMMLNQGGAAFNPIAVVHVHHTVDLAHFSVVNVAADDAVET